MKPSDLTRKARKIAQREREQAAIDEQIRALKGEILGLRKKVVSQETVRQEIIRLSKATVPQPKWMLDTTTTGKVLGVPTLLASDWHWGEVVDRKQVGGVNEYNLSIANRRAKSLIENTIKILRNEFSRKDIPGIVFALGGDMVSGDIHEELSRTNEQPIMPVVLNIFGVLSECLEVLADEFGRVFVPCVSGNHSRITHKPFSKERNHLSFDWLLYSFLAKKYEKDTRLTFRVPEGPNCEWSVYNQRYLLNHGDEFRGGDGMIGPLGPIIRGDHKKRSKGSQIGAGYDTMLLCHFHRYMPLGDQLIVNGSLVGYSEYANAGNFGFEPPKQALWITHPERGITFQMPVLVEESKKMDNRPWVSWPE